jgi:UDP-galactopyranose mutase
MAKALILGGGFAGCTAAHLLRRAGWEVTLIEKEPALGGGCRTFFHCGHPFTYGPRLYYGYSQKVFEWVHAHSPLKRYPFELLTLAHEPVDADRRFWTYPPHEDDLADYPRAAQIAAELAARDNSTEPADFDEYYRQRTGATIYEMFTDHYSRRMWMIESNKVLDTFKWSAKDKPIESGSREAYKGAYLAYPEAVDGYNAYFEKMVEGCEVILGANAKAVNLKPGQPAPAVRVENRYLDADVIVSTLPIDELLQHKLGDLPYAGRDFQLLVLPRPRGENGYADIYPGNVRFCHFAGAADEFTRVTEFRKVTGHGPADSTLLVLEKPSRSNKLYPFLTKANIAKAAEYQAMLPSNVHSIGRLGTYKYSTIEQTVVQAFQCVARITGQPSMEGCEGEWKGIGDTSMMKDRKEAA